MNRSECLQLAKELTGSSEIAVLIRAAEDIERYSKNENSTMGLGTPLLFSRFLDFCNIRHPFKGCIPFKSYTFQYPLIHDLTEITSNHAYNKNLLYNCSRQMGITTLVALFSIWESMKTKNTHIRSIHTRAAVGFDFIETAYYTAVNIPRSFGNLRSNTKGTLTFDNGSRITTGTIHKIIDPDLPKPDYVILNDMAYFPWGRDAELEKTLEVLVEQGTRLIALSTPATANGLFHKLWTSDNKTNHTNEAKLQFGKRAFSWKEHPDRDEEWAKPYREQLGENQFAQEFENQFRDH